MPYATHNADAMLTDSLEHRLQTIALDHLFIDTLQTRHSDRLDFHEVSVWAVRSALLAAYRAGQGDAMRQGDAVSE